MKRSSIVLALLAVVLAALFVRLGLWQLDRRAQRMETNAFRAARGAMPPVRLIGSEDGSAPVPSADSIAWRRVRLAGRFDREHEMIIRSRSRDGSPGVELLTPLMIGSDSPPEPAILVLRGWMPASDGIRPRLSDAWPVAAPERDGPELVEVEGVAVPGVERAASTPIRVEIEGLERTVLAAVNLSQARELLPYRVAGFYVRASAAGATGPGLAPLRDPQYGEGPHLSYALQWFAFAVIALVGTAIYLRKEHGR